MIQMYRGKHFSKLSHSQIRGDLAYLEQFFTFVDNSKLYKPDDILGLFKQSGADVGLIDPFTGLDREMSFAGNYEFMNRARQFANQTGMTIYINKFNKKHHPKQKPLPNKLIQTVQNLFFC
jgi:hypothetical protein